MHADATGGSTSTEDELRDARTLEKKRRKKRKMGRPSPPLLSGEEGMKRGRGISSGEVLSFDDNLPEEPPAPVGKPERVEEALDVALGTSGPSDGVGAGLDNLRVVVACLDIERRGSRVPEAVVASTSTPAPRRKDAPAPVKIQTQVPPRSVEPGVRDKELARKKKREREKKRWRRKRERERAMKGGKSLTPGPQAGSLRAQTQEQEPRMGVPAKKMTAEGPQAGRGSEAQGGGNLFSGNKEGGKGQGRSLKSSL